MGWPPGTSREKLPEHTVQAGNTALGASFPPIRDIDTAKGIAMTGGTEEGYRRVLSMFRKDTDERLQRLRFFLYESMNSGKFPEKHLASFITQIYALKSASAAIGAAKISDEAAKLEAAGNNSDLSFIQDNLPDFTEHLTELVKNIRSALESMPDKSGGHGFFSHVLGWKKADKSLSAKGDSSGYLPLLEKLAEALGSKNVTDIDRILEELSKIPLDLKVKEILEQISDQVLMAEFESAIKTINELRGNNGNR